MNARACLVCDSVVMSRSGHRLVSMPSNREWKGFLFTLVTGERKGKGNDWEDEAALLLILLPRSKFINRPVTSTHGHAKNCAGSVDTQIVAVAAIQ